MQEGWRRAVGCCFRGGGAGLVVAMVEVREGGAAGRALDMFVGVGGE